MKMATVRKFAMSLPEVSEAPHHNYGSFRVSGKIFVTFPPGEEFIHVFVPDELRDEAVTVYSAFVENLHWGSKIVGVRICLAGADAAVVKRFVKDAWTYKAPKPAK
jgi:hypothetical protein